MKKIVFTGGGTAGHIMPNIAIIEQLKDYKIYYFGSNGMEKDILKNYPNVIFVEIPAVKFIRSLTLKNLLIPYKLYKSIKLAKQYLSKIQPSLIFSKGGFVSLPTCLAGNKLNIPVLTHESDLTIGLANKLIARKSKHLCCSFRETAEQYGKNAIFTSSPIREKILKGNKEIVRTRHNLNYNKPIILIVGGSLGAKSINEAIWDNIDKLLEKYTLIHIVGRNNYNNNLKNKNNYIQLEFASDIENYFAISDMVISRAGSNTIFELLSIQKPMLLIPLSKQSSRGDQILNAENFAENKFANILYQEELNYNNLINKIEETLVNKYTYIKNMKTSEYRNGNKNLLELINKYTK